MSLAGSVAQGGNLSRSLTNIWFRHSWSPQVDFLNPATVSVSAVLWFNECRVAAPPASSLCLSICYTVPSSSSHLFLYFSSFHLLISFCSHTFPPSFPLHEPVSLLLCILWPFLSLTLSSFAFFVGIRPLSSSLTFKAASE